MLVLGAVSAKTWGTRDPSEEVSPPTDFKSCDPSFFTIETFRLLVEPGEGGPNTGRSTLIAFRLRLSSVMATLNLIAPPTAIGLGIMALSIVIATGCLLEVMLR